VSEPSEPPDPARGPFRDNAREADPEPPWSIPAILAIPSVLFGWLAAGLMAEGMGEVWMHASAAGLLLGGVLGLFGLMDTRPHPEHAGAVDLPPPKRGRGLAKLGFAFLLGPIVLGCLFFGLLLLTCMGH
jgi:hypothetical protein